MIVRVIRLAPIVVRYPYVVFQAVMADTQTTDRRIAELQVVLTQELVKSEIALIV